MSDISCAKCGSQVGEDEVQEYAGRTLCEDCYMEAISPTRTCDPWAVHTARSLKDLPGGQSLTAEQQRLYDLIKEKGKVPIPEAAAHLGVSEDELRRVFAPLRHMEKLRACKEDDRVLLTLF